ncbi:ATP-binding protein [Cohnella endophytica]|nr:ATP-binding protein [Cohnella endophytica]
MNDILEFTRLESGKQETDEQPFSVKETIAYAMSGYKKIAAEKKLAFSCHIDNGVPNYVLGDPHLYGKMLVRLIDNAIKFTSNGQVDIFVKTVGEQASSNGAILLETSVKDTGIGIHELKKELLFLPFSQLDTSYSRNYDGLGMGLAIAQAIAKALGGYIRLADNDGAGANFVALIEVQPFEVPQDQPAIVLS